MSEIEKGIPMPPTRYGKGTRSKMGKIVHDMEVGDSYLCDNEWEALNAQSIAYSKGLKLSRRHTPEGYRIWRIE